MIASLTVRELTPEAVARHGVVRVAAGRRLSPAELVALAARVGRPKAFSLAKYRPAEFPPEVTLLDSHGDGVTAAPRGFGEGWHQDSTFLSAPPEYTVLHAWDVPEAGGETAFADTRPALAALTADERASLGRMKVRHALRSSYRVSAADVGRRLQDVLAGLSSAEHPALAAHPRGGDALLLSPLYAKDGVAPEDRPLYGRVLREVVRSRFAHRWSAGDVLIWDNRVVLHAAAAYKGDARRRLIRVVAHDEAAS